MIQIRNNTQKFLVVTIWGFALLYFFVFSYEVLAAATFSVTPVIIDGKAKPRDILNESITLSSTSGRKLNVYTFVNNIATIEGRQEFLDPSKTDHSLSLANWIVISRGVIELSTGEKKIIDFRINVNLRAKPGIYHAVISFVEGPTRAYAEKRLEEAPKVTVNLEVIEDIKERLQLKRFIPDKTFFSGFPVSFSYELENIGNRPTAHSGEIRIYNRRGEEVAAITVNEKSISLEPDAAIELASVWQKTETVGNLASAGGAFGEFGRYKAFLDLEYGSKQTGTIQDTVFFWVIPWQKIIVMFVVLAFFVILITYFLHRKYEGKREKRYNKAERSHVFDIKHPRDSI